MSGGAKALAWGVAVALLLAGGMLMIATAGGLNLSRGEPQGEVLVVGTAPDERGTELAAFAFVVDRELLSVRVVDTLAPVTVSGTSATNAREALPYGGGEAVARALAPQTGGAMLPWIVLRSEDWSELVDAAGGLRVAVPERLNAYSAGRLAIIEAGDQRLTGDEAVVLAGSVPYLSASGSASRTLQALSASVSALVTTGDTLRSLTASDGIERSQEVRGLFNLRAE